ncbi:hypothetical protein M2432_005114 [Mycobacterium sp. OTB74]|nr:hypothetical protein [Mycobacterium sp. OTB74]
MILTLSLWAQWFHLWSPCAGCDLGPICLGRRARVGPLAIVFMQVKYHKCVLVGLRVVRAVLIFTPGKPSGGAT